MRPNLQFPVTRYVPPSSNITYNNCPQAANIQAPLNVGTVDTAIQAMDSQRAFQSPLQPRTGPARYDNVRQLYAAYQRLKEVLLKSPMWLHICNAIKTQQRTVWFHSAVLLEPGSLIIACPAAPAPPTADGFAALTPPANGCNMHGGKEPPGLWHVTLFLAIIDALPKPPVMAGMFHAFVQDCRGQLTEIEKQFLGELGVGIWQTDSYGRDIQTKGSFGTPVVGSLMKQIVNERSFVFAPGAAVWSGWSRAPALIICKELAVVHAMLVTRVQSRLGEYEADGWDADANALENFRISRDVDYLRRLDTDVEVFHALAAYHAPAIHTQPGINNRMQTSVPAAEQSPNAGYSSPATSQSHTRSQSQTRQQAHQARRAGKVQRRNAIALAESPQRGALPMPTTAGGYNASQTMVGGTMHQHLYLTQAAVQPANPSPLRIVTTLLGDSQIHTAEGHSSSSIATTDLVGNIPQQARPTAGSELGFTIQDEFWPWSASQEGREAFAFETPTDAAAGLLLDEGDMGQAELSWNIGSILDIDEGSNNHGPQTGPGLP